MAFAAPGDVRATPATTLLAGAVAGAWAAGVVVETRLRILWFTVPSLVHSASCTFSFTGVGGDGATAVAGASTVTLSSWFVLRRGDSASDSDGNAVKA
jgi:hypothetical protein